MPVVARQRRGKGSDSGSDSSKTTRLQAATVSPAGSLPATKAPSKKLPKGRSRKEWLGIWLAIMGSFVLGTQIMGLVRWLDDAVTSRHNLLNGEYEYDTEFFQQMQGRLPVVVVGGSDGSGTRAVVDTLKALGVAILSDDPQTFDIHGAVMFGKKGWPKLITTILQATKGNVNYTWDELPTATQQIVEREVQKLLNSIAIKYAGERRRHRLQSKTFPQPNALRAKLDRTQHNKALDPSPATTRVAFAIKAPVTMLVLPVLTRFMGPIQFLHVVRE